MRKGALDQQLARALNRRRTTEYVFINGNCSGARPQRAGI
jgi:hypothetical protein